MSGDAVIEVAGAVAVTGANSGIGRECCRRLLGQGRRVYGLDLADDGLAELVDTHPGQLVPLTCDVADEGSVAGAFAQIGRTDIALDALVCSAGVLRTGPLMAMDAADFDRLFAVNVRGPWLCARAALPLLRRAASDACPARVVMVGSIGAIRPKVGGGAYAASKAALARIVRVLGVELAAEHIRVNAVAPSTVDTPMIAAAAADRASTYRPSGLSPLGRVASPADIAAVIDFLLSPASDYMTGAVVPVDGGVSAAFSPPR